MKPMNTSGNSDVPFGLINLTMLTKNFKTFAKAGCLGVEAINSKA